MKRTLRDQAAIVGIGQTEFSKNSGRSELQLAAEASLAAIHDAGLQPTDIDGMATFTLDSSDELLLMRALGIQEVNYWSRAPFGGAGANTTIMQAAAAVASGAARHMLVWRAFNERSGHRFGQPQDPGTTLGWNWYLPFGLDTPAKIYSLTFQRYMDRYGFTNEDMGHYPVVARKHAATNPAALCLGRFPAGSSARVAGRVSAPRTRASVPSSSPPPTACARGCHRTLDPPPASDLAPRWSQDGVVGEEEELRVK